MQNTDLHHPLFGVGSIANGHGADREFAKSGNRRFLADDQWVYAQKTVNRAYGFRDCSQLEQLQLTEHRKGQNTTPFYIEIVILK